MNLVDYTQVNYPSIQLSKPKLNSDTECYSSKIFLDDIPDENIKIQTPKMILDSDPIFIASKNIYLLNLRFQSEISDHIEFYQFLYNVDRYLIYTVINNDGWFQSELDDNIEDMYKSSIKIPEHLNSSPRFQVIIPIQDSQGGQIIPKIFDSNQKEISLDDLKENREIILILELKKLVFTENFFYPKWEAYQIMLPNFPPSNNKFEFNSDTDENDSSPDDNSLIGDTEIDSENADIQKSPLKSEKQKSEINLDSKIASASVTVTLPSSNIQDTLEKNEEDNNSKVENSSIDSSISSISPASSSKDTKKETEEESDGSKDSKKGKRIINALDKINLVSTYLETDSDSG